MRAFLSKYFYNVNISFTFMCDLAPPVWPMYLSKFRLWFSVLKANHFPWINDAWRGFLCCLLPSCLLISKFVILAPSPQELCCLNLAGQGSWLSAHGTQEGTSEDHWSWQILYERSLVREPDALTRDPGKFALIIGTDIELPWIICGKVDNGFKGMRDKG